MKKKFINLILNVIIVLSLSQGLQAEASEYNIEFSPKISEQAAFTNSVLIETDSSIVIDMHMRPAKKNPIPQIVYDNPVNSYKTTKSPAQITRQGRFYFIADTFHNQVLYHDTLEDPVSKWKVVTSKVSGPHSIASDGQYYLIADTENNQILIYEWDRGGLRLTQQFEDFGIRPHYIDYDKTTDSFYIWSSMTCEMYILTKNSEGTLCIKEIRKLKNMSEQYIRSFTISENYILFPSGTNKEILITDKNTLQVVERFIVPGELSGMAYIRQIGNYFYMTVSTDDNFDQSKATIIRTKDLNSLMQGEYEDISFCFPGLIVPYYIDYIHGNYYMTNHGNNTSVFRFQIINDEIKYVKPMEY